MTYHKVKPITQTRRIEASKIKSTFTTNNNSCQVVKILQALFRICNIVAVVVIVLEPFLYAYFIKLFRCRAAARTTQTGSKVRTKMRYK